MDEEIEEKGRKFINYIFFSKTTLDIKKTKGKWFWKTITFIFHTLYSDRSIELFVN
jgi:hypothetical protein